MTLINLTIRRLRHSVCQRKSVGVLVLLAASIALLATLQYNLDLHVTPDNSITIHIAVVICGNRYEQGITLLKSAFIFSQSKLVFHIFTDNRHRKPITNEIGSWTLTPSQRLQVRMYEPQFPQPDKAHPNLTIAFWRSLFRPCAAQRLFFPVIMTDVDSVIYLDTDALFLSPVENVWSQFQKFSSSQLAGVIHELNDWYPKKSKVPYCSATGLNSGVFLMNLTRLRASTWTDSMKDYSMNYTREELRLGDQDLINIYCHFHEDGDYTTVSPDATCLHVDPASTQTEHYSMKCCLKISEGQFYVMPCTYNYRGMFCPANKPCNEAETSGTFILHGNDYAFVKNRFPALKGIYNAVKEFRPRNETFHDLYTNMRTNIMQHSSTECGKRPYLFTQNLEKFITENEQKRENVFIKFMKMLIA